MFELRAVIVCAECQVHWYDGQQPAKCVVSDHVHQIFEMHRHRSIVSLPDGTQVTAVSFDDMDPYARDELPDYGLYLDERWQPPWTHDHIEWPDFGVPDSPAQLAGALRSLLDRARAGERVEVGCLGGHGRTGTALACLAVLCGQPPDTAVDWIRANYCTHAVETPVQQTFVLDFKG